MRSRSFIFTFNNPPDDLWTDDDALDAWLHRLGCDYGVAGREIAPTTQTRHLQGYVRWKNARSVAGVRRLLVGCHVEPARGTAQQCREYCIKDGKFVEFGEVPEDAGTREVERWENARAMAKEGRFEEVPADIYIRYVGNLERIFRKELPPLESLPRTCGLWVVGPTGVGKSRGTRERFPGLYPKPLNKWWDGYAEQPVVLLDDVDNNQVSWIGHFLKIWSDHYPFIAEMKGGSKLIRPKQVVVTSQYSIMQLFTNDDALRDALLRRFEVVEVRKDVPIEWPEDMINIVLVEEEEVNL